MKIMGIYEIKNLITEEIYIGSSRSVRQREISHFSTLRRGVHDNHRLQKSYNKYGGENFSFSIIEVVEKIEDLIEREQYWLDELKPQFNIISKADNHSVNMTEELAISHKRHGELMRGKKKSEEGRRNIIEGRRKYFSNPENRKKQSVIIRGVAKEISDSVSQYIYIFISPDGKEVETRSIRRFSRENHLSENWMYHLKNGHRKSNSGWTFKEKKFIGYKKDRG